MPRWKEKDISEFQKLYVEEYGVALNEEEASVRITALVGLISLAIEVENQEKTKKISIQKYPKGRLSELD